MPVIATRYPVRSFDPGSGLPVVLHTGTEVTLSQKTDILAKALVADVEIDDYLGNPEDLSDMINATRAWVKALVRDLVDGDASLGKSAYQLAVENGFMGSLADWLDSLHGPAGESAYDLAVDQGFTGTVSEWLDSLGGGGGGGGGMPTVDIAHVTGLQAIIDALGKRVTSVNGDEGPEVNTGLSDLTGVQLDAATYDDNGVQLTPDPGDYDFMGWDPVQRLVRNKPITSESHNHDGVYAPANFKSQYALYGFITGPTRDPVPDPATLPPGDYVILDEAVLNGPGRPQPNDFGLVAENFDLVQATAQLQPSASRLYSGWLPVRFDVDLTTVMVSCTSAGTGVTTSGLVLFDASTGARLGYSTGLKDEDDANTDFNSNGLKYGSFTAVSREQLAHVVAALWFIGGSVAPQFARATTTVYSANARKKGSSLIRNGIGAVNSAPNPTPPSTLPTLTTGTAMWFGVY